MDWDVVNWLKNEFTVLRIEVYVYVIYNMGAFAV